MESVSKYKFVKKIHAGKEMTYSCGNIEEMYTLNGMQAIFGKEAFKFHNSDNHDISVKCKLDMNGENSY